jgi:hypothetical protein
MEELFGAGILGTTWRVNPNLDTASCQFSMDPSAASVEADCTKQKISLHLDPKLDW